MENLNNDVFGFGVESDEDLEQVNTFNYDSISGLGESNYENEDLFNVELDHSTPIINDYRIGTFDDNANINSEYNDNELIVQNYNKMFVDETNKVPAIEQLDDVTFAYDFKDENHDNLNEIEQEENINVPFEVFNVVPENNIEEIVEFPNFEDLNIEPTIENSIDEQEEIVNVPFDENLFNKENVNYNELSEHVLKTDNNIEFESYNDEQPQDSTQQIEEVTDESQDIYMSDTPIEELNALTHYEKEKIEQTDISDLFEKVSVNVKDASDIFRKNTDLKRKIDVRFEELKKLQSEIENARKKQIDEINNYKEEVLTKLTEKKEEIEKRLNLLKETQSALEKEKQEFEQYKKTEQQNIDRVQKEVQAAYDDRREELSHIEDILRKQKDALDEERSQLSLDMIQYESDKNELANNLLKFNELVNSFTNGIEDIKE